MVKRHLVVEMLHSSTTPTEMLPAGFFNCFLSAPNPSFLHCVLMMGRGLSDHLSAWLGGSKLGCVTRGTRGRTKGHAPSCLFPGGFLPACSSRESALQRFTLREQYLSRAPAKFSLQCPPHVETPVSHRDSRISWLSPPSRSGSQAHRAPHFKLRSTHQSSSSTS